MNIEENDFRTPVLACGDRLGYVHIGENNRGYLGAGHIDFGSALRCASGRWGYAGAVTFESFSSAVLEPNVSNTLGIWRNVWSDSEGPGTSGAPIHRHPDGGGRPGLTVG